MATPDVPQQYLDIRQFSRLTNLSVPTVRRRVAQGTIPALQPGGPGTKLLFRPDALERAAAADVSAATANPPPADAPLAGPEPKWLTPGGLPARRPDGDP
jgi:excisionase family DNA binding protein